MKSSIINLLGNDYNFFQLSASLLPIIGISTIALVWGDGSCLEILDYGEVLQLCKGDLNWHLDFLIFVDLFLLPFCWLSFHSNILMVGFRDLPIKEKKS